MGGDGTVSQVVDALMNRSQKEKGVDFKTGASAAAAPLPLGIIPTGQYIAQSKTILKLWYLDVWVVCFLS